MRSLKNKMFISISCSLLLIFFMMTFFTGCKQAVKEKEKNYLRIIPVSEIYSIFGQAKGTKSGVLDILQSVGEVTISYGFYPKDISNFDNEIGLELTPKIKDFYKKEEKVDKAIFIVFIPSPVRPSGWKPFVSFLITRELVQKTAWINMLDTELLDLAIEVKYFD